MRSAPAWATRKRPGSRRRCRPSPCGGREYLLRRSFRRVTAGSKAAVVVLDAEAAAGVDVADVDVRLCCNSAMRFVTRLEGGAEGVDCADLRADVDADAGGREPLRFCCPAVDGAGGVDVDAELVGGEAGGDVGVGFGEDVGVDAEGEAGGCAEELGAGGEEVEFWRRTRR